MAGNCQRAGAGLTAWRQRPAPVRCRAKAAGQAAAHQRRVPFHLCPGGGPPTRPLASSRIVRAYAEEARPRPAMFAPRSSGLDKGRRAVSCPAIGLPLACPL